MINSILVICLIVLVSLVMYLLSERRKRRRDIDYITRKLNDILEANSMEQVKIFTDIKPIQNLLVVINKILNHNMETLASGKRQEQMMKRLFSDVSHDLRTPLTVIAGYIETLSLYPKTEEDYEDMLIKLNGKTQKLIGLINNFFDLAKLESGDLVIPMTTVEVNEMSRLLLLGYYQQLSELGIELVLDIPKGVLLCRGNEEVLNRVLDNLISNAVKYGKDGNLLGLTIEAKENNIYIHVWDRGKGIEPDYQEAVFQRLFTLEDSRNQNYQGSGIGLTIARSLTEQMGGRLTLYSRPYQMTKFTVQLNRSADYRNFQQQSKK